MKTETEMELKQNLNEKLNWNWINRRNSDKTETGK